MKNASYGSMLQDYYHARFAAISASRQQVLNHVVSAGDALRYREEVRAKLRRAYGEFPQTDAPLNPRITGTFTANGVKVDKVLFDSLPGYPVSALFFRKSGQRGKRPGVLGLCGHSAEGKAEDAYMSFCFALAQKGFAVLIIDPASQGERGQFDDCDPAEPCRSGCCSEHNQMGKSLLLCGDFFARWRIWDALRGLDYLLSRAEVDPARVGVTGNSGGGTMTTYLWALEPRLTMAAPGCYVTSFARNFDNELPVDAEQVIPGLFADGFEMADYLIARAPEPVIILGRENDFFDPRGTKQAYEEARKIYELLGKPENIAYVSKPGGHGYGQESREAMVAFFAEHAGVKIKSAREAQLELPDEVETYAAPSGSTARIKDAITLPDLLSIRVAELAKERGKAAPETIRRFIEEKLQAALPAVAPDYQVLRGVGLPDGRTLSRFGIRTEPGARGFIFIADTGAHNVLPVQPEPTLYIAHLDAEEELAELPSGVLALDVRGVGASAPSTTDRDPANGYFAMYSADYFYDSAGAMCRDPFFGGKIRDVLAVLRLLRDSGSGPVHLVGHGLGSVVAAFAAAAAPECCARITLSGVPLGWGEMIKRKVYRWPQSHLPQGMLELFDLADLYRMLTPYGLSLVEPWDDHFQAWDVRALKKELKATGVDPALVH